MEIKHNLIRLLSEEWSFVGRRGGDIRTPLRIKMVQDGVQHMEFTNGDIDLINGNHVGQYEYESCDIEKAPYIIGDMYLELHAHEYYIDDNGLRFDGIDDTEYGMEFIIKKEDRFYSLSTYIYEKGIPREIIPIQTDFKKLPESFTKIDLVRYDEFGFIYAHITNLRGEYFIINAKFVTEVIGVDCDSNHSHPIILRFADRSVNFAISREHANPRLLSYEDVLQPDSNLIHAENTFENIKTPHSMHGKYKLIKSKGVCSKIFQSKDKKSVILTDSGLYYQPVISSY